MKIKKRPRHTQNTPSSRGAGSSGKRFLLIRNPVISGSEWIPGQARHDEIKLTGQQ